MQDIQTRLKLDPWAASSLLQKAVRRGEGELTCFAAQELHRYRGKGVWRRLWSIAREDIGIADPELVAETGFLASDQKARALLGEEAELIASTVRKLAAAPKDRSTDYLICWALKTSEGKHEQEQLARVSPAELVTMATDDEQPLLRRAAAVLTACTDADTIVLGPVLKRLLDALEARQPSRLHAAIEVAARSKFGAYVLMAPILWSALRQQPDRSAAVHQDVPRAELLGGVPLYTYDKHTWAGKRAISRFAKENDQVRNTLAGYVAPHAREKVAYMAAFYADAIPISLRLDWAHSASLQQMGMEADMISAGSPQSTARAIVEAVQANLDHLNALRRSAALGRAGGAL